MPKFASKRIFQLLDSTTSILPSEKESEAIARHHFEEK